MKKENKKLATELLENEKRLQKQELEEHFTGVVFVDPLEGELDKFLPDDLVKLIKELIHD